MVYVYATVNLSYIIRNASNARLDLHLHLTNLYANVLPLGMLSIDKHGDATNALIIHNPIKEEHVFVT
jgi:hypothetical protein